MILINEEKKSEGNDKLILSEESLCKLRKDFVQVKVTSFFENDYYTIGL